MSVSVYITYVETDGPLLKLWGQTNKKSSILIEQTLLTYKADFSQGYGVPRGSSLYCGLMCCAKYAADGSFYRAKVLGLENVSRGEVLVHFIDFGNQETVTLENLRLFDSQQLETMASVPALAEEFYMAGIISSHGEWSLDQLSFIRQNLCYFDFKCVIVSSVGSKKLVLVIFEGTDFIKRLIELGLGMSIAISAQEVLLEGIYQMNAGGKHSSFREPVSGRMQLTHTSNVGGNRILSVPILEVGSEHNVRVSYIDEGPSAFSLQLVSRDVAFHELLQGLQENRPCPLKGPLLPGAVCVVECPVNKIPCRAVVTALYDHECKVYFVDIGHTTIVPFTEIFELPEEHLLAASFSVPFSLGGLQQHSFDDSGKKLFEELVKGKVLTLRVITPQGPPVRQYGDLFLNGENLLSLLLHRIRDLRVTYSFPAPLCPNIGEDVLVTVSHVVSVSNFFVHLERNNEQLNEIRDRIDLYCQDDVPGISYRQLCPGTPVCARYPSDENWYRAKTMSVTGDHVSVVYVDYGNTEILPLASLRQIDPGLIEISAQAVGCCLRISETLEDSERLSAQLEEDTAGKVLKMTVVGHLQNGMLLVDLLDISVIPPIDIGSKILCLSSDGDVAETNEWQDSEMINDVPEAHSSLGEEHGRSGDCEGEKRPQKNAGGWKGQPGYTEYHDHQFQSEKFQNGKRFDNHEHSHMDDRKPTSKQNFRGNDRGYGFKNREKDTHIKKWSGGEEKQHYSERSETFSGREGRGGYSHKPKQFSTGEDRKWNSGDRRNVSHGERNSEQKWDRNDRSRGESDNKGHGSGRQYTEKYRNDIGTRSSSEHATGSFKKKDPPTNDYSRNNYTERKNARVKPHQSLDSSQFRGSLLQDDPNLRVFRSAVVPVGKKEHVQLVYAASPSNFVVQVSTNSQQLSDMMTDIAAKYESEDEPTLPAVVVKVGTPCIARFPADNNWYRAVVEEVSDSNVVVTFVDYGNKDTVTLDDLKKASLDLHAIPVLGIQCSLLGAQAQNSEWSEEEISSFMDLTDGKPLMAHFCRKTGSSVEVILRGLVDGNEEDISINEKFGAVNLKESLLTLSTVKSPEFASAGDHYNELNITPGMTEKVVVTWFVNPEHFFCQIKSTNTAFVDMMKNIQISTVERKAFNHSVPIGTPVIAKFPSDNVLYRAEVKEEAVLGGCVVQFVDYGNSEVVDFYNIWPIDKTFMSIPRQALVCSLMGVLPVDSEWPTKYSDYEKFFGVEDLDCNFLGTTTDGKNSVSLYQDGTSVAVELVNCGLAVAVESSADHGAEEVEGPLHLELLKGQQLAAHVTYIKSVFDFSVQLEPKIAGKLQDRLQQLEDKEPLNLEEYPNFSDLCLVTSDGSQCFRGKILEVDTSDLLVELVDFGNQCRVEKSNVWSLPLPLSSVPLQAVKCCVSGASTASIPSDLEDHFKMEVEDQDVIMLVNEVMDGRLSVQLFDVEGQRLELLKTLDNSAAVEVNPLCPYPVLRTTAHCWIVHVGGPYALWMQRVNDADDLAKLLEDLYTFYEAEGRGNPHLIEVDKICAVKSEADGGWYRACIKEKTEEGISVCFVDYGNSEIVPIENIKELDPSFFSPPCLAFCASLPLLVIDEVKSSEILAEVVSEVEFFVTLRRSATNKWLVDTGETNNLSKQLLDQHMAFPIEPAIVIGEIPSIPQLESQVRVVVSHIDSPEKFWVQQECCVNYIHSIAFCLLDAGSFSSPNFIQKEMMCAAFCQDKMQWCRGLILSVRESDNALYEVYFIDNGKIEFVDDVRELPKNLVKIPPLSIKCSLKLPEGVETWPEGSAEEFCKLSGDGKAVFVMEIEMVGEPLLVSLLQDGRDIGLELLQQDSANSNSSEVFISHITSLSDFWIQDNSLSHQLDVVTEKLYEGEAFDPLPEIVNGTVCAALFADDGQWYRAKILSCNDQDIHVLYIDYGNSSSTTDVRSLPSELLNIPPLAKHCSLTCPREQMEWPATAEEEFFEIFGDGGKVFELSVLHEGNPSIVSLNLLGQKVEDLLLNKIKILSENETNCDSGVKDQLTEENTTEETDAAPGLGQFSNEKNCDFGVNDQLPEESDAVPNVDQWKTETDCDSGVNDQLTEENNTAETNATPNLDQLKNETNCDFGVNDQLAEENTTAETDAAPNVDHFKNETNFDSGVNEQLPEESDATPNLDQCKNETDSDSGVNEQLPKESGATPNLDPCKNETTCHSGVSDEHTEENTTAETAATPELDQIDSENVCLSEDATSVGGISDHTFSKTCIEAELNQNENCSPLPGNALLVNRVSLEKTDEKNNTAEISIAVEENDLTKNETLEDTLKGESPGSCSETSKTQGKADCSESKEESSVHVENTGMAEVVAHETSFSEQLVRDLQVQLKTPLNDSVPKSCAEQTAETMHDLSCEQQKDSSALESEVHLQKVPECTNFEKQNVDGET